MRFFLRLLPAVALAALGFIAGVVFARSTEARDSEVRVIGKLPGGATVYRFQDATGRPHVFAESANGVVTPLCP